MERGTFTGRLAVLAATAGAAALVAGCAGQSPQSSADNVVKGKQLFVAKCGSCHTLARAGTKGSVGPNLDAAFKESLAEGFGRSVVRGVVAYQIKHPARSGPMPANLVTGDGVTDVAAYVAISAAKGGQDSGLLASAVKAAGAGKPAEAKNGTIEIDADPTGQLAFVTNKANAPAGKLTVKMGNQSSVQHDIAIEGNGVTGKGPIVGKGGTSQFQTDLKPGTYTYFCTVQGHRAAGMVGTLTVK